MSARQTILAEMTDVAALQKKTLASLDDDLPLLESGLDSLGFAILVARLEDKLGADPFLSGEAFPATLGELIAFYDRVPA